MSDLAWMKVYIGTETARTADLTPEEFGCYERLRRHYWVHHGLPDDDKRIMRITHVDPERWPDVRSGICGLFAEGWRLPDLDNELAVAGEKRARAIDRSQKAHAARYGDRRSTKTSAISTSTSSAYSSASSSRQTMPQAVLEACASASASDNIRYEERLAPTHAHARTRETASEIPLDPPETEAEGREWLTREGLWPKETSALLPALMSGTLHRSQVEEAKKRKAWPR